MPNTGFSSVPYLRALTRLGILVAPHSLLEPFLSILPCFGVLRPSFSPESAFSFLLLRDILLALSTESRERARQRVRYFLSLEVIAA